MLDIVIGNSNSFGILQSISDSKKENIGNQNHVLRKKRKGRVMHQKLVNM